MSDEHRLKTQDLLRRIFDVIELSPDEANNALLDLDNLTKLSALQALVNGLDKVMIDELNGRITGKCPEDQQKEIARTINKRYTGQEIQNETVLAAENVIGEYLEFIVKQAAPQQRQAILDLMKEGAQRFLFQDTTSSRV